MFNASERLPNAPIGLLMVVAHVPSCRRTRPAQVRYSTQINRRSDIIPWIFGGCDSTTEEIEQLESFPEGNKDQLKGWQKYHQKMSGSRLSIATETREYEPAASRCAPEQIAFMGCSVTSKEDTINRLEISHSELIEQNRNRRRPVTVNVLISSEDDYNHWGWVHTAQPLPFTAWARSGRSA